MKATILRAREYGTDRPVEIGRIESPDGNITLTLRYTDEEGDWFPTWTGRKGEAVQVPRGWRLSDEMLEVLASAPYEEQP